MAGEAAVAWWPSKTYPLLRHGLQTSSDGQSVGAFVYWFLEAVSARKEETVRTTFKALAILLLGVAAVRFYPDFARYMKIRAM